MGDLARPGWAIGGTMPKDQKQQIVVVKPSPPNLATVTPLRCIAGDNTKAINLKDHPELDGATIIITKARLASGDMGVYIVMGCYIVPDAQTQPTDENAITLMTGAENIVDRVGICANDPELFPVVGTLRKAGRAWFLD
jgi:hypothetical protein